jgi:hypothetical protein
VLANWHLYDLTHDETYRDIAVACSETILETQRPDGAWAYPNPEWKGRYATAEGVWASLGLLETCRHTSERRFLNGVLKWHNFMEDSIGYQQIGDQLAVNYFANRQVGRVPNNTAFVLRFLAELSQVTHNKTHLTRCKDLLTFMEAVQKTSGEFPYTVPGFGEENEEQHFQCYQYNAFQCLDLMKYYDITQDKRALPIIEKVLIFLRGGLGRDGHAHYDCLSPHHTVTYHTAVMAAAFCKAAQMGLDKYAPLAERAYSHVLRSQFPNGSFPHSRGDYGILADQRPYPRYLAMILTHLLQPYPVQKRSNHGPRKESARAGVR